jgi:hypothetical protein
VLVLRSVEKKLGLAARLAACIRDRRKPERIEHPLEEPDGSAPQDHSHRGAVAASSPSSKPPTSQNQM